MLPGLKVILLCGLCGREIYISRGHALSTTTSLIRKAVVGHLVKELILSRKDLYKDISMPSTGSR